MWLILVTIVLALIVSKVFQLVRFWDGQGIPYESYPRYLYRTFWLNKRRVTYEVHRENVRKYGTVYGTYRLLTPTLAVADAEISKEVLIKQFHNFFTRSFEFRTGDPLWDKTLPRLSYEEWKIVRTITGHTLTATKMRGVIMKTDKVSKRVVEKLRKFILTEHNELELLKHLQGFAMDTMTAVAFGLDPNCIDNPESPFVTNASNIFQPGLTLMLFFAMPKVMQRIPFVNFPPKATMKFFGEVAHHILTEKRGKLDEVTANNTADVLDLHLMAQKGEKKLTDDLIASQALLFLLAGLDTTAIALDLTTYYLAVYPECQQRAIEEIRAVIDGRMKIEYQDVQKMKYLEAFIMESLRATPTSTSIVDRVCTENTEVAGIRINKGMLIEFISSDMHLNPDYFPDPEQFLPERFLPGPIGDQQNLHAFLFFGDGPKNCVGKRLAIMNMQTLLANLLLSFKIEKCERTPELPLKFKVGEHFSKNFEQPFVVRLVPREWIHTCWTNVDIIPALES